MAGRFSVEAVFKAVDRITGPVNRMQNRVGKFTRSLTRGLRNVDRITSKVTKGFVSVGKAAAGLAAGAVAGGAVTDALTAADVRAQQLAKSIDGDVGELKALAASVSGAGFEFDNVIDLVEEMNNKLGESSGLEATTPVLESLEILGLKYERIKKLAPQEQFKAIADAAIGMEDAQKAASAADILMGGEANKLIGVLRQQGGTLDEIIGRYDSLNVRTEASRKGAASFQEQMRSAKFAVSSVSSEVAGLVGKSLAPLLKRLTEWTRANNDLIKTKVSDFVDELNNGLNWLIENFDSVVKWTKRVGTGLVVFVSFVAILKTLIGVMTAVNLVMAANPITWIILGIVALTAAIAAAIIYWDDIKAAIARFGASIMDDAAPAIEWLKGAAGLVTGAWDGVTDFFSDLWGGVTAKFESAWGTIGSIVDKVRGALDFVSNSAGKIKDAAGGAVDRATGFVSDAASGVAGMLGFGDDEEEVPAQRGGRGQMVSPQERVARSVEESRSTSTSEVTIKDETGRAEVTGGRMGPGLKLQPSGAF